MTVSLPVDRPLHKDEKKVIYQAFHAGSCKIYSAALIFAHGGNGAEKLSDWRGALVLARERSSDMHFLSFFKLQVDEHLPGVTDLMLVLSDKSKMRSGTHLHKDVLKNVIYTDLVSL